MTFAKLNRVLHRWGAVVAALPLLVIIASGIVLQLKKESAWIQPTTTKGSSQELAIGFDRILDVARSVPEAEVSGWGDIERLDVRPSKGMVKVRCANRMEVQVDTSTGDVLQVAVRRSDLIESIHDGSFFHEKAKFWVFLPAGVLLTLLWASGLYLFLVPYLAKRRRRREGGTA